MMKVKIIYPNNLFLLSCVAVLLGVLNALKRESFGGDFLTYESHYYNKEIFFDPLYYILQNLFSSLSVPFSVFWMILTTGAIYSVGKFSFQRAPSIVFYVVVLPPLFFLTLSGHSRSGFALGVFCLAFNRGNSVQKSLFTSGLMHVGSLVILFIYIISSSKIKVANKIFILTSASLIIYFIINNYWEGFDNLGKANYYRMLSLSYLSSDDPQHRSLWSLNNIRLWFWLAILIYLRIACVKDKNLYTSVAFSYLLFGFDAYIAQKSTLIFLPIIGLLFFNEKKSNKIELYFLKILGIVFVLLSNAIDVFERLYII